MKTLKIKDICDKGSSNLKQKDVQNQEGKYPVFGASGIIGKIDTYHQDKEYIAIVKDGSGIGRVSFMPAYSSVIGTLQYILPKNGYNIKYISYCLQSLDLANFKQGAAIPHIYFRDYGEYEVNVEENIQEQQQIVEYLDAQFKRIDALKANAEQQLQAAKDLFQSALKDLMTPKEGWVEKELKTICQVINGRAYKQDEMLQVGKYRLLRVGNFFTNDKWYYSDLELEDDKYCCNGDLLYAWSASFGPRIWNGEKVIYHYHIWKLICSDCIDKHYLFYWLDSDIFKTQVMRDLHGATMNHITKSIMETTIVWFPCIDTQKIIVARLDALSANVKALQTNYAETITLCNDLKQALLKKVFG